MVTLYKCVLSNWVQHYITMVMIIVVITIIIIIITKCNSNHVMKYNTLTGSEGMRNCQTKLAALCKLALQSFVQSFRHLWSQQLLSDTLCAFGLQSFVQWFKRVRPQLGSTCSRNPHLRASGTWNPRLGPTWLWPDCMIIVNTPISWDPPPRVRLDRSLWIMRACTASAKIGCLKRAREESWGAMRAKEIHPRHLRNCLTQTPNFEFLRLWFRRTALRFESG